MEMDGQGRGDWISTPIRQPIFNIPAVLAVLLSLMITVHLVRAVILSSELDRVLLGFTAFLPARYLYPLADQNAGWWLGPVTHSFLHGGLAHLALNTVWMAVFATPIARRIGAIRFILFWAISAAASAFFFAASTGFEASYLIGASGVVSATSGAVCRFAIPQSGFSPTKLVVAQPRLSVFSALKLRSVQAFVFFWLLFNLLTGLGMTLGTTNVGAIAWQAHIGGFLFGYLAFALFDRRQGAF